MVFFNMLRRNSSRKKMAVTKSKQNSPKDNNRMSSSKFKSKLSLVLSSSYQKNTGNTKTPVKYGDYIHLETLISEKKISLPATVMVKRFGNEQDNLESTKVNGLATLQAYKEIISLKCLAPDSTEVEVPITNGSITVNFLSIDNTAVFNTLGELRSKRREKNITWFVATKEFTVDKNTYNVGQIFSFASQNILSSFKRDRNVRGVTVALYPSLRKEFLPFGAEGDFKKCDAPTTSQSAILSEISKSDNFPYFMSLPSESLPTHLKHRVGMQLFVKEKCISKFIYVSRKIRGSLQIHSFPVYSDLYVKTLDRPSVDHLDNNELKIMLKSFECVKREDDGFCVKTYNEIGILRLLDEIFTELSQHEEGVYTQLLDSKKFQGQPTQKRVIKTYLRNSCFNGSPILPHKYLKGIDGKNDNENNNDVIQNGSHRNHHNTKSRTEEEECGKTRELVVEFDDGGYVIIPFLGKSPRISLDNDVMKYKSSDNVAYNYREEQRHDSEEAYDQLYDLTCDEHVYTYISTDELDCIVRPKDKQTNSGNSCDEEVRLSFAYDYSDIGHFSMPPSLSRSNIRQMNIEETVNVLKFNQMKHHIDIFREYRITGVELAKLTEKDLIEMELTRFEARKLTCFLDGWRPKEGSSGDSASWLSKLAKDWTVYDVTRYLQHTGMLSFQRFVQRHSIDGFLLKAILNDDVMESLTSQHNLALRQADVMRLRNYILQDEKPRFKYFS